MASNALIAPPPLPDAPSDPTLDPLREKLIRYADSAIETLHNVAENGDKDAARVAAAGSILDRIGLVKPVAPPTPNTLPAEVISAAIAGLGAVFGRQFGPIPTLRDVTPAQGEALGAPNGDSGAGGARSRRPGAPGKGASPSVLRKKAAPRGQAAEP